MKPLDFTDFLGITNSKAKEPEPADNPIFDLQKLGEKKVLYEWEAPSRTPLKQFGGKLNKNLIIIGVVIALLLILIGEYFLILVAASAIFIQYILSSTPTEDIEYKITNHGINYAGHLYYWNELGNFFLTEEEGVPVLNVDVKDELPARLFLTLTEKNKEKVKELCGKYLPYLKEKPETLMDRAYNKIVSKLDL